MDNPQTQVELNEIGQIALTAGNLAEAKAFYRDVLGMRFLFDAETMCFFQCGSVRLMIGTSEKLVDPGGTILYFRVPNIREANASLLAKGVAFVQEPHLVARMKSHDLWLAFFKDPAGNTLALMSEEAREKQGSTAG
jgi:predicted enzyme related to lactoylglutathione lyase